MIPTFKIKMTPLIRLDFNLGFEKLLINQSKAKSLKEVQRSRPVVASLKTDAQMYHLGRRYG